MKMLLKLTKYTVLIAIFSWTTSVAHSAVLFEDNFTGSLTWNKSGSSVYIKDNDFLYIGANGAYNDGWAEKNLHIPLSSGNPIIIEQRLKLKSTPFLWLQKIL